jgi:hypothetical protein
LNSLENSSSPERVKEVITPLLQVNEDFTKSIGLLKHFAADILPPVRYDLATVLIGQGRRSYGEQLREANRDTRDSLDSAISWFQYAVDFEVPMTDDPGQDLSHVRTRFSDSCLPRMLDVALFGEAACIELKPWTHAALVADATSAEVQRRLYDGSGLPIDMVTRDFVDEQLKYVVMFWFDGWGLNVSRVTETSRYLLSLAVNNVGGLVNLLLGYRHDGRFNLNGLYDHFGREAVLNCAEIALENSVISEDQRTTIGALKAEILAPVAPSDEVHQDTRLGPEGSQ